MQPWHQRNQLDTDFPLHLFLSYDLEFPPHWHEELEFIYVLEGEMQTGLGTEVHRLSTGDILVIGTGEVHYFLRSATLAKNKVLILQFPHSLFDTLSPAMDRSRFLKPHLACHAEHKALYSTMQNVLEGMMQEYAQKEAGYLLALKGYLYELLVLLVRQMPKEAYSDFEHRRQLSRLDRLEQVFRFVDANYCGDIPLKDAAAIANYSMYHFTRFFKEATGMTFARYLNQVRLRRAIQLLASTGDPVTEVAFRVGFNSIKTFNRLFKEQMGCAPTAYRKGASMHP